MFPHVRVKRYWWQMSYKAHVFIVFLIFRSKFILRQNEHPRIVIVFAISPPLFPRVSGTDQNYDVHINNSAKLMMVLLLKH